MPPPASVQDCNKKTKVKKTKSTNEEVHGVKILGLGFREAWGLWAFPRLSCTKLGFWRGCHRSRASCVQDSLHLLVSAWAHCYCGTMRRRWATWILLRSCVTRLHRSHPLFNPSAALLPSVRCLGTTATLRDDGGGGSNLFYHPPSFIVSSLSLSLFIRDRCFVFSLISFFSPVLDVFWQVKELWWRNVGGSSSQILRNGGTIGWRR